MRRLKIIRRLNDIRDTATMKNADFTDEVKSMTKLWRETWIIEPLNSIIEEMEMKK